MSRRLSAPRGFPSLSLSLVFLLILSIPPAASAVDADEFDYVARPGDTLIGLGRRLLRQPQMWHELQLRNSIANPYRIRPGSTIRIPYSWLKLSDEIASVAKVAGAVTSAGQPLAAGQSLSKGTVVETGPDGSVAIDLADGSRIVLHKSSSLRLSEMQRVDGVPNAHDIQVQLPDGHADTIVKPHRDVGRFEIVTPTAALAVRGTVFRTSMLAGPGTVTTETLEGVVAVSANGETVATTADFGTRVEKGAAPLKPVPLLPAPDLSGLPGTSLHRELHLEIPSLAGAKSYHLQVSDDPEFKTFTADVLSEQPVVDVASLPDGTFWLRVRGVDTQGIEGHDAARSFIQQALPEPPKSQSPAGGASVEGPVTRFVWSAVPEVARFELQVADDVEFSHLRADEKVASETQAVVKSLPPGKYFWRVASSNAAGQTGDWSDPQTFVQRLPPPQPELVSIDRHELHFTWSVEPGQMYRAQISADPGFRHLLFNTTLTEGTLSWRRPWPGTYYIRVVPLQPDGMVDPKATGTPFEVPVPLWIRITAPVVILVPLLF